MDMIYFPSEIILPLLTPFTGNSKSTQNSEKCEMLLWYVPFRRHELGVKSLNRLKLGFRKDVKEKQNVVFECNMDQNCSVLYNSSFFISVSSKGIVTFTEINLDLKNPSLGQGEFQNCL